MRVRIQDIPPNTYTPRAVIETDDGKHVAYVSWSAGYRDPDEAQQKAKAIATATQFAASDVMLTALRDAAESLRRLPDTDGAFRNTVLRQCEKAIAAAGGKSD